MTGADVPQQLRLDCAAGSTLINTRRNSLIDTKTPLRQIDLNQRALNSPSFDRLKGMIDNGATNLDLMKTGYAPFGPDGKQLNLHHILGEAQGYDKFRRNYWKQRAEDFE